MGISTTLENDPLHDHPTFATKERHKFRLEDFCFAYLRLSRQWNACKTGLPYWSNPRFTNTNANVRLSLQEGLAFLTNRWTGPSKSGQVWPSLVKSCQKLTKYWTILLLVLNIFGKVAALWVQIAPFCETDY